MNTKRNEVGKPPLRISARRSQGRADLFCKKTKLVRRYIRAVTPKRSKKLREYSVLRKMFLVEHPACAVFPKKAATTIHHTRGRLGALLLDKRYWLAVSLAGHQWIDAHPAIARERGWLCAKGQWNKQPEAV